MTVAPEAYKTRWWLCRCGHRLIDHGSIKVPGQSGHTYQGCKQCPSCEGFQNDAGQVFSNGELK